MFDSPKGVRLADGRPQEVFAARHLELHGRPTREGKPGIEAGIRLEQAVFPLWAATAAQPIDGVIDAVLHGITDFAPKPLSERLRELQAAGGGIEIKQARLVQGDVLAVGGGALSFNAAGRLDGQLRVTIAGLEALLERIGAKQMVQSSSAMDKFAGALDRLAPGLGSMARQQVTENSAPGSRRSANRRRSKAAKRCRCRCASRTVRCCSGPSRWGGFSSGRDQLLLCRVRLRQRLVRQAGCGRPKSGAGEILADLDDAAADRARAREMLEQRVAVAVADRARERRDVLVEAAEHLQHGVLVGEEDVAPHGRIGGGDAGEIAEAAGGEFQHLRARHVCRVRRRCRRWCRRSGAAGGW